MPSASSEDRTHGTSSETWTEFFIVLSRAPITALTNWASVSKNETDHYAYTQGKKGEIMKCMNSLSTANHLLRCARMTEVPAGEVGQLFRKRELSLGFPTGCVSVAACFMVTEWTLKSSELGLEFLLHHLPLVTLGKFISALIFSCRKWREY